MYNNFWEGIIHNQVFQVSFMSWFLAQFGKVVMTLVIDKKLNLYRMIGSGGMPSSHSGFVTGLTTAVGLTSGFDTPIFAVSLVLALVVMYDASGVRRAVGKQAMLLNRIIEDLYENKPIDHERLKELVGHTPIEVFFGAALGIFIANIMI
jgi:acid phosphatase family membrane protein YuiD